MIKYSFKVFMMLAVGLFTAVFIYPFLHEAGHAMMCIIFGGKVVTLKLFPLPCTVCDLSNVSRIGVVFSAFGGLLVPSVITLLFSPKSYLIRYILFIMVLISMLSIAISSTVVLFYVSGKPLNDFDVNLVLQINIINPLVILIIFSALLFILYRKAIRLQPTRMLYSYFDFI